MGSLRLHFVSLRMTNKDEISPLRCTSVEMTLYGLDSSTSFHYAQNDIFMRSSRLHCVPLSGWQTRMRCLHCGRHDNHHTIQITKSKTRVKGGFHHEVISSCRDFICPSRQISFFVPTKSGWDPYDFTLFRSGWRIWMRSLRLHSVPLRMTFLSDSSTGLRMTNKD